MIALRRLPLSFRLPLLSSALMVLVGVVASQQVLAALGRVQDARIRELAEQQVEALSLALGPAVLRSDVWEVYDVLDRAGRLSEGRRAAFSVVADSDGRVLAATDPRRAPIGSAIDDVAEGAQALDAIDVRASTKAIRVAAPLVYQGREVGRVATELDVSDLAAERRRAVAYLLVGNAAATIALAAAGYLATKRMLRPIAALARHMGDGSGKPSPIAPSAAPAGDGEVATLYRAFNAMTEAVEARAEAERRLAERERFVSLGRLSSSLAHEINNPLGGLLVAADTIQAYADRPDVVRESGALIERGLKHLRDVARATLEQNRLDRDGARLGSGDFADLRILFEPEARRLAQSLDWEIDAPEAALARYPAAPVRQILLNLLLNASAAAGERGAVAVSAAQDDAGLRMTVTDDGPGLTEEAVARLTTSRPLEPGGGVGLRLVRDLVNGLGGEVVHVRRGGRTAIVVRLGAGEAA